MGIALENSNSYICCNDNSRNIAILCKSEFYFLKNTFPYEKSKLQFQHCLINISTTNFADLGTH